MKFKRLLTVGSMLVSMTIGATVASALPGFQYKYVNTPLGTTFGNGQGCAACHNGANTKSTLNTPYFKSYLSTFKNPSLLAGLDSDGDGFTNKQEVSGNSFNFNAANITPFTLAKAAESSTSTKVVITGGVVTETAIVDVYSEAGITVEAGNEIAGDVSPLATITPATITFAKPIVSPSKVYTVDLIAKTSSELTAADITYNEDGSITVKGLTPNVNLIVERVKTNYNAKVGGNNNGGNNNGDNDGGDNDGGDNDGGDNDGGDNDGGDNDGGDNGSSGNGSSATTDVPKAPACVADASSTPLMMLLAMLSIGYFIRRKKS